MLGSDFFLFIMSHQFKPIINSDIFHHICCYQSIGRVIFLNLEVIDRVDLALLREQDPVCQCHLDFVLSFVNGRQN